MAEMTVDELAAILDQIVKDIPPRFLRKLNGGVNLRPGTKRVGPRCVLGEYVEEQNGACYIVIHYGSLKEILAEEPAEAWREEVTKTVQKGIQHHLESLAARTRLPKIKLGIWQESSKKVKRIYRG
ncbi:MAG: hypothetical protein ABRQ24_04350 [Syntrophomonadaceae bacterium]